MNDKTYPRPSERTHALTASWSVGASLETAMDTFEIIMFWIQGSLDLIGSITIWP